MNKYVKLNQLATPYAIRMARLRNRIFGNVVRKTDRPSMRVVRMFEEKPLYKREEIINYYPRHVETAALMKKLRDYGLFIDEFEDFKEEMERMRVLRGKVKYVRGEKKAKSN